MRFESFLIAAVMLTMQTLGLRAQNAPAGYMYVDSLIYTPVSAVDSTLAGKSIWEALPETVSVSQGDEAMRIVNDFVDRNSGKSFPGYRIRIFFDNKQNSRSASEAAVAKFKSIHPGTSVYRTFTNPFFKVTVGDYRTRSEALAALNYIKPDFPSAFIVKEKLRYPAVNNRNAVRVDTLRILKPISNL